MKRFLLLIALLTLTACGPAPDIATVDPPDFIDTGVDSNGWAVIPAGVYPSGIHDHLTEIDYDYQIMITDVTNEQFAQFLNEAVGDHTLSIGDVEVQESENIFVYLL